MPRYYYYGVAVAVLLSGVFILRESLWTPPSPVAYKQDPMSSVLDGVVKGNNNDSNNNNGGKLARKKTNDSIESVTLADWIAEYQLAFEAHAANSTNDTLNVAQPAQSLSPLLALEVESVSHIPEECKVVVDFRKNNSRKCRNPRIFGRISGPYVALIEWEDKLTATEESNPTAGNTTVSGNNATTTDIPMVHQMVGRYSVPSRGRYFIEVIGLFCNGPQWNQSFQKTCMEDPTRHRITQDTAFISVTTVSSLSSELAFGHWKWSPPTINQTKLSNLTDHDNEDPRNQPPLLTRYQPQNCRTSLDLKTDRCRIPMSLDRFTPYQFDDNDAAGRVRSQLSQWGNKTVLLCFVGLSHSRELAREVGLWLSEWNATNIQAISMDAQFPRLVNPRRIASRRCTATVVASGQWSAGLKPSGGKYRGMGPTGFPEYEDEVMNMVARLKKRKLTNLFLRSIHYNALGDIKTTCPPQDWRSPPVIDAYNDILVDLTTSRKVPFIDTNFIVGPMWDISADLCHYKNDRVARAEALYVLSRILSA